jgi:hypothetical protein
MDGLGRPAPFPSVGAGAGPIVPPPHGIVFGRAAAGAAAHPIQNGGSNRNVSPSRNRKVPPVVAKQQQPVPKQQQAAPPKASVKNSELLREEQAKARRLLRFAQAGDKPDSASGRLEEHGVSNRELRQPKGELVVRQTRTEAPRRPQGKLVDFAAHDEAMEMEGPEALGDDFRNVEAIIGTCTDMCPGEFLLLLCLLLSFFLSSRKESSCAWFSHMHEALCWELMKSVVGHGGQSLLFMA